MKDYRIYKNGTHEIIAYFDTLEQAKEACFQHNVQLAEDNEADWYYHEQRDARLQEGWGW